LISPLDNVGQTRRIHHVRHLTVQLIRTKLLFIEPDCGLEYYYYNRRPGRTNTKFPLNLSTV